jgi:DNA-binding transcriptional LysR family regulator
MDGVRGIDSFVKAVQAGSIAAGARRLGISPAAASQNITRLEKQLGTRLLTRTTRSLALTDSGQIYFERVQGLINDLELANQAVSAVNNEPRGRLCIASTGAFARHVVARSLPEFKRRYPRITTELIVTDRNVDHIKESVDISIRIKPALQPGLVARRIARVPSIFCASPGYLEREGVPTEPEHLRDHDCLVFRFPVDGRFLNWGFIRNGIRFDIDVRATMISDDIDTLAAMAVAGAGITRLADFVARPLIETGQLKEIFVVNNKARTQVEVEPLEFYLCVADRHQLTPKVKAFSEYLSEILPQQWRS